jgi:CRISPR-associated protein Cas2
MLNTRPTAQPRWLVAYDIADKRRLGRVHRLVRKHGIPLQYSLFLVRASAPEMDALMAQLEGVVDAQADDVRAYRLPSKSWSVTLGSAILLQDLWIDP